MTAYGLVERFKATANEQRPDPGAYQFCNYHTFKKSKAPFLSNKPRKIAEPKPWTEAIYDADIRPHVPACTALRSKSPRFAYEAFSQEDLEKLLCRCGLPIPCECPIACRCGLLIPCECPIAKEGEPPNNICQGKVPKRLFIGPPPHSILGEGLSSPSKKDCGFKILPDGSLKRIRKEIADEPPFYDASVNEFTKIYHGCKWSRWTGQRAMKSLEQRPGPADYTIITKTTPEARCAEEVRHQRRKTAKLCRFMEMVQQPHIREGRPGPATYSPQTPRTDFVNSLGPKAERFTTSKYEVSPGPADYKVPRAYDFPPELKIQCHAKLPCYSTFGMANRFKPLKSDGPGPASYEARYDPKITCCTKAPFGVSAKRFQSSVPIDDEDFDDEDELEELNEEHPDEEPNVSCPNLSWMFKSTTIRMKLSKDIDRREPLQQPKRHLRWPQKFQYMKPFDSSEGRFQPWNNWFPCHNKVDSPGPGYYCLDKPRCTSAARGLLFRAARFQNAISSYPAPNYYDIDQSLLKKTYNQRLKKNLKTKCYEIRKIPDEPLEMSYEDKKHALLQQAIAILDEKENDFKSRRSKKTVETLEAVKPKLLRYFLHKHKIPVTF